MSTSLSRLLALSWTFVLLLISAGHAQQIEWRPSLEAAQADFAKEPRLILLHFGATWCRPCQQLERYVFNDSRVIEMVNSNLIPVRIDIDQAPDLVRRYGITNIPTDVFVNGDGALVMNTRSGQSAAEWKNTVEQALRTWTAIREGGPMATRMREQMAELQQTWEQHRAAEAAAQSGESTFVIADFHAQDHFRTGSVGQGASAEPSRNAAAGVTASPTVRNGSRFGMDSEGGQLTGSGTGNSPVADGGYYVGAPSEPGHSVPPTPTEPAAPEPAAMNQPSAMPSVAPKRVENLFQASNRTCSANSCDGAGRLDCGAGPTGPVPLRPLEPTAPALSLLGPSPVPGSRGNGEPTLCLDGICPVTLVAENRAVRGQPDLGCIHRGRVYLFASPERRDEFLRDPDRWSPMLAGFDPVEFERSGQLVPGSREFGTLMVQEGQATIVLFSSAENRQLFQADAAPYLGLVREAVARTAGVQRD